MRRTLIAAGAVGLLLAATACGGSATGASGGDDTLTIGIGVPAMPWNLAEAGSGPEAQYYQPVFDSLIRLSPEAEPTPNVATSWSYDESRTKLTLELRSGLAFTDGLPVDAEAVRANLMHTKSGTKTAATDLRAVSGVDVIDPDTAVVNLAAPDPALTTALGGVAGMLASPASLTAASGPVGSGPYALDRGATTDGQQYTYTRNPGYWNSSAFPFNKIVIKYISDATARTNALLAGQLDTSPLTAQRAQAAKDRGINVIDYDAGQIQGLFIWDRGGTVVPALGDPKVRQALNYAFDRAAISKAADLGYSAPTTQPFNTKSVAFDEALNSRYTYDPAKARQLLAEAGYPNGFEVTVPDFAGKYAEAQAAMVQSLTDIGITVHLDNMPSDQIFTAILAGKYPMSFFRLEATTPWRTIQLQMQEGSTWNPFRYHDPVLDRMVQEIQFAPDADTSPRYRDVNAYIVEQAWNVPWTSVQNLYGISDKVSVTPQAFSLYPPLYQIQTATH